MSEGDGTSSTFSIRYHSLSIQFKNGFDLDRDVARKRSHADGAARADAVFFAPDLGKEFAATINYRRMIGKVRCRVNHAENFDEPSNSRNQSVRLQGRDDG